MSLARERFQPDPRTGRDLVLVTATAPEDVAELRAQSLGPFLALVAWHAAGASVDTISAVVTALLDAGCCAVSAWGADCERVHDICDEVAVERALDAGTDGGGVLMTSWHDDESLDDALWFALRSTEPDADFVAPLGRPCRTVLALVVGDEPGLAAAIRAAFRDPGAFDARVLAQPDP